MSRKAVLIGINAYPNAPLAGCVNDIWSIKKRLIEKHGFRLEDIRILLDAQATTRNILEALSWLADSKPGDIALLWFSGHGTQVATGSSDEPDGLAECVCPFDFDWSPGRMVTDKQFVEAFKKMPAGVLFNWGSDSCHSGDLQRSIGTAPRPGFLGKLWRAVAFWRKPEPPLMRSRSMPLPIWAAIRIGRAKSKGHRARAIINGNMDVGFVSGCRSDQTSADTVIDGVPCGALTYYFVKNLNSAPAGSTLKAVVALTTNDLVKYGYSQRPLVEGTRVDKPFLG
jgi:hypothetical protein